MINETAIDKESENFKQYGTALSLIGNDNAFMQHLIVWFMPALKQPLPQLASIVYGNASLRRIHINFHILSHLAAALSSLAFLIRCSALPPAGWGNRESNVCGLARHLLPELLQFQFTPSMPCQDTQPVTQLQPDIKALLSEMKMEHSGSAFWFSKHHDPSHNSGPYCFNVLPRHIAEQGLVVLVSHLHLDSSFRPVVIKELVATKLDVAC